MRFLVGKIRESVLVEHDVSAYMSYKDLNASSEPCLSMVISSASCVFTSFSNVLFLRYGK